ncbi:HEAT repeat domain-containing protein [Streptomyces sp. NPDC006208]|uniref:HEAT repeat domain-containing protein n=1 Tax=Streptomyces sp. NPDC006208 TaxID=3156734 RepID=UPI0033AA3918
MGDTELIAAVRRGDADAVRALLEEGADADALDADGLPVLCTAVAAYDDPVAEALMDGGADPDRPLPDGTTPLLRAVDLGSPAIFSTVLGHEPRLRLPEAARERLLTLARTWYATGAAEELRRRTGATGPAERVRVQDDEYHHVDQVTLGGLTVRAGHGAVLTSLEWAFRVLPPVEELVARGLKYADEDHVDWWSAKWILSQRRSKETWLAVTAFRHHPDPAHRRFVLDFLRIRSLTGASDRNSYDKEESRLFAAWAAEETDVDVLAKVLDAFVGYEHPGMQSIGLGYVGHPDPRVRREVPALLTTWGNPYPPPTPPARAALLRLARDPDSEVRAGAGYWLGTCHDLTLEVHQTLIALTRDPDPEVRTRTAGALAASPDRTSAAADALVALLDEEDVQARLNAAYGLVLRDDPRTEEATGRVGPLGPGFEHDHRDSAIRRWKWERKKTEREKGSATTEQ